MRFAILDTNIYIDHWERGYYGEALETVRQAYIVRQSAVVLSELRRGAHTPDAEQLVSNPSRIAPTRWEPTAEDWWQAGGIIRKIGDKKGWETGKRRDFQNDALIALTARRHGATVVTADVADFELLTRELRVSVLFVQ